MQLLYTKATCAAIWVFSLAMMGLATNPTTLLEWAVLACFGLVPPIAMWRLWNHPEPTMSQSINEALR